MNGTTRVLFDPYSRLMTVLIALLGGLAAGVLLVLLSDRTSPKFASMLIIGGVVTIGILIRPQWGLWVTAVVIPLERFGRFTDDSSMYTLSLMRLVGTLALVAFLLHALARKSTIRFGRPTILYGLYFCFAALSVFHTSDFLGSVRGAGAILGNLLFFFFMINIVRDYQTARRAIDIWLVVSVLVGIYVIYDWHFGTKKLNEDNIGDTAYRFATVWSDASEWQGLGSGVLRAMGPTSHAAVYGINLILTIPFFFYQLRRTISPAHRALIFASLGVIYYNVLLTNTRAVIMLSIIVLLICIARRLFVPKVVAVVAGVLLVCACIPFIPESVTDRILNPKNYTAAESGTLRIRFEYWQAGLKIIGDHWLLGIGVGNENEVPKYISVVGPEVTTVHCEYIQTFMEVGILGWVAFFSFVGALLVYALRAGRRLKQVRGPDEAYWFVIACQIAMISVLMFGTQVDVFHFPLKGWWLVAGISYVMYFNACSASPTPLRKGAVPA